MTGDDLEQLLKLAELKRHKELSEGGSANFSIKGKKGDSIKKIERIGDDLVITLSRPKGDEVINLGSVKGEAGNDADEVMIANKLASLLKKEVSIIKKQIPSEDKISLRVLDDLASEVPNMVASTVAPILASISREKTDLEAIRGQLEALLADGNERIAEAIKTAEGKIKDIKPTRGVHFGGTVHQRMTAFSFNDSSNRTASTYLKVGSSTMNSNEGVPMIRP